MDAAQREVDRLVRERRHKMVLTAIKWVVVPAAVVIEVVWYGVNGLTSYDLLSAWIALLGLTIAVSIVAGAKKYPRVWWLAPIVPACAAIVWWLMQSTGTSWVHFGVWCALISGSLGALVVTDPRNAR